MNKENYVLQLCDRQASRSADDLKELQSLIPYWGRKEQTRKDIQSMHALEPARRKQSPRRPTAREGPLFAPQSQ